MRLPQQAVCLLLLGTQGVMAMGDRFAWSPQEEVEGRGSKEIAGAEREQVVRTVRKTEELGEEVVRKTEELGEQVEGRFVGKEVLCSLGLADCTPKLSDSIQYVQPVKVVPYGSPVPAIEAQGQYSVPIGDNDRQFNTEYGAPKPSYGAPKPSYGAPKPSYGAPKPTYGAPKPTYGAPKPSYGAPKPSYGAPTPTYNTPEPSYGAPKPVYKAPAPVYAPPPAKYGAPTSGYGAPAAPVVGGGNIRDQRETDIKTDFQRVTEFQTEFDSLTEVARPTREGRLEECVCMPVAQCPAGSAVKSVFKDYSALINPRVKDKNHGITAPEGRSGLEVVSVTATQADNQEEKELEEILAVEGEEITRRRRDGLSTDKEEAGDRLANVWVPEQEEELVEEYDEDYDYEDGLFLSRDGSEIELKEAFKEMDLEERKQRRAARRAERQARRKAAAAAVETTIKKEEEDSNLAEENADLVDAVGQDKSFDSLASFTDDVTTKVGSVKDGVSSGVTRIFGDLTNLIAGSTSSGQLKPVVGVSFGLPQAGPGYGNYQQNPVGTGGAVNPYYTGAQGLEVGPVNLNPLFSFQAGTTDTGELSLNPLVNLHLTPNGCGVLGCDKSTYDSVDFALKSIPNPIDAVKRFFEGSPDYGVYGDYTAPQPSYAAPGYVSPSSGYGPPSPDYGVPSPGYGPPSAGYGTPIDGYGPPNTGYGPPTNGYGPPSDGYEAPLKPSYQPPKTPYHPPKNTYTPASHYETSQTVGPVNVHHHYHHQGAGARDTAWEDDNNVKRNVENGGFLPMEGLTLPQAQGGAFRFPRTHGGRGARKLELPAETAGEEVELSGFRFNKENGARRLDMEEGEMVGEEGGRRLDAEEGEMMEKAVKEEEVDRADTVEVVYSEEVAPEGGKVKFVERKRRSPDGAGHHGHHQADHGSNAFGPNGVRPPTCGGPSSGYVCCRTSSPSFQSQPALDFNELAPASSIRDVRQQPQQFNGVIGGAQHAEFSTFGQCGRKNHQGITGRINNPANSFNEGDTEFGEYPWQAAILKKEKYDNVYVCGGSLIDSSHILTAAHCVRQYRPEELRIRLGEWDVNNDSEFYPNIELDVLSISIHPDFYSGNLYNDIAVVKLDGFLDFQRNPHISPVCLPDSLAEFAGERGFVTGWGKDAFGGDGSYQHTLKEVDVPVLGHYDCERKLQRTRLGQDFSLHPGFICAGGEEGKDACKGDGGGPLVVEVGGSWQLAGLVSWGVGCGQRDVPGVYVKVGEYNQWIQEMMLTT